MNKITILIAPLLVSQSLYAAPVTVDFLVNATDRYTTSNDNWVRDSNFSGQQFTLSVVFDSDNYNPGLFDYWDGQGISSYRPDIYPVSIGDTPFDEELNAVQSTLDYHGNVEGSTSGSSYGEYSYNQTFESGLISQSFYQNSGVVYYDTPRRYIADFDRDISLDFFDHNADLIEADIVPLTLEDYLGLGYGRTFNFYQSVEEDYNENWTNGGQWISVDGGIRYSGSATMTSISTVPVPAAVWLFGSGLIGLVSFAGRKKA